MRSGPNASMMRRWTVVLPEPDPPAMPMTTGMRSVLVFFLAGGLRGGLLLGDAGAFGAALGATLLPARPRNHHDGALPRLLVERRGVLIEFVAAGRLPVEERLDALGGITDDVVDEGAAELLDAVRDGPEVTVLLVVEPDLDEGAVGAVVVPGGAVDLREEVPDELAAERLVERGAEHRPPVGRDLPDLRERRVHLQAIVRDEVVGPEEPEEAGEDDAVFEEATLRFGGKLRELHRSVHHAGTVAVYRSQERTSEHVEVNLDGLFERVTFHAEELLEGCLVFLLDRLLEGRDELAPFRVEI